METRGPINLEVLGALAGDLGADSKAVLNRMNTEAVSDVIRKNHQLAERMRIGTRPSSSAARCCVACSRRRAGCRSAVRGRVRESRVDPPRRPWRGRHGYLDMKKPGAARGMRSAFHSAALVSVGLGAFSALSIGGAGLDQFDDMCSIICSLTSCDPDGRKIDHARCRRRRRCEADIGHQRLARAIDHAADDRQAHRGLDVFKAFSAISTVLMTSKPCRARSWGS